ncbi:uncharacterized protein V1518DRAFT_417444 [Limtongia smithiae]|uniref:uncharacterized protein n=1 Tax=Limtongia smithiae TaxID=1125753 RepID=UPI0034CEA0EB
MAFYYTSATSAVTLLSSITASLLFAIIDLLIAACTAHIPGFYTRVKALSHSHEFLRIGISEYNLWRFRRRRAAKDVEAEAGYERSPSYRRLSNSTIASDWTSAEPSMNRSAGLELPELAGDKEILPNAGGYHGDDVTDSANVVLAVPCRYTLRQRIVLVCSNTMVLILALLLAYALVILSWGLGHAANVTTHSAETPMSVDTLEAAPIELSTMFTDAGIRGLDYNSTASTVGSWDMTESSMLLFGANGTYTEDDESETMACGYIEEIYYASYLATNIKRSIALAAGNFSTYRLVCYKTNATDSLFRISYTDSVAANTGVGNSLVAFGDQQSSVMFVNVNGTIKSKYMTGVSRTEQYITNSGYTSDVLENILYSDPLAGWTRDYATMVIVATKSVDGNATMKVATTYDEYNDFVTSDSYQYADFVLTMQDTSESTGQQNRTLYWHLSANAEMYTASTVYSMYDLSTSVVSATVDTSHAVDDTAAMEGSEGDVTLAFSTVFIGRQYDVQMAVWRFFRDLVGSDEWSMTQTLTSTVFDITTLVYLLGASFAVYFVIIVACWIFKFKFAQRAIVYHLYSELAKPPGAAAESILSINKDLNGSVHETEIELEQPHGLIKMKTYKCGLAS